MKNIYYTVGIVKNEIDELLKYYLEKKWKIYGVNKDN